MSFNIPAHVLSMPTSIVKFCEVDFSKYANAIGAFYRVDPNLEHINLLDSMAVVAKKSSGDTLPLKVLTVAGISAALVFGAYFILNQINIGIRRETTKIEARILAGDFDDKRVEMTRLERVRDNFSEYKYRAKLAQTLYDFQPRGDLPQIVDELRCSADYGYQRPAVLRYCFRVD
jgi:hypothetical protein